MCKKIKIKIWFKWFIITSGFSLICLAYTVSKQLPVINIFLLSVIPISTNVRGQVGHINTLKRLLLGADHYQKKHFLQQWISWIQLYQFFCSESCLVLGLNLSSKTEALSILMLHFMIEWVQMHNKCLSSNNFFYTGYHLG